MKIPTICIEVTPDIATKIRFLAESGVFALRTGNASLNFHEGQLKSIKTEIMAYAQNEKVIPIDISEVHIKV